jgi:hypothetical protein
MKVLMTVLEYAFALVIIAAPMLYAHRLGVRSTPLSRAPTQFWRDATTLAALGVIVVSWGSFILLYTAALHFVVFGPRGLGVVFIVLGPIALVGGTVTAVRIQRRQLARSRRRQQLQREPHHDV